MKVISAPPLPPLVGTRIRAQALCARLPLDLTGEEVAIDGRYVLAATKTFADELVRIIIVERNAEVMALRNFSDTEFYDWALESATSYNVAERIKFKTGSLGD